MSSKTQAANRVSFVSKNGKVDSADEQSADVTRSKQRPQRPQSAYARRRIPSSNRSKRPKRPQSARATRRSRSQGRGKRKDHGRSGKRSRLPKRYGQIRRVRPSQPQLLQSHVQKKLTHAKRAQSVPRVYRKLFAASRSEYSVVSHPRRVREKSSNGSETKTKDPTYLYDTSRNLISIGMAPADSLAQLNLQALVFEKTKQYKTLIAARIHSIALYRLCFGVDDIRSIHAQSRLASAYLLEGLHRQALHHSTQILSHLSDKERKRKKERGNKIRAAHPDMSWLESKPMEEEEEKHADSEEEQDILIATHYTLGRVFLESNQWGRAKRHLEMALVSNRKLHGINAFSNVTFLRPLALVYERRQRHAKSVDMLLRVWELKEEVCGSDDFGMVPIYLDIGKLYMTSKLYTKAQENLQRVLNITNQLLIKEKADQKRKQKDHKSTNLVSSDMMLVYLATAHLCLGDIHRRSQKYQKAVTHFQTALQIIQDNTSSYAFTNTSTLSISEQKGIDSKHNSDDHKHTYNQANRANGSAPRGLQRNERAPTFSISLRGILHLSISPSPTPLSSLSLVLLRQMARSHSAARQYSKAISVYSTILQYERSLFGPIDNEIIRTLKRISSVYVRANKLSKAKHAMEQCVNIAKKLFGSRNKITDDLKGKVQDIVTAIRDQKERIREQQIKKDNERYERQRELEEKAKAHEISPRQRRSRSRRGRRSKSRGKGKRRKKRSHRKGIPMRATEVSLYAHIGKFVCVLKDHTVMCNGDSVGENEILSFEHHPEKVAIKSAHGRYMSVNPEGIVTWNQEKVTDAEMFSMKGLKDSQIALLAHNGKYICCERNGQLMANRNSIGPWESFTTKEIKREEKEKESKETKEEPTKVQSKDETETKEQKDIKVENKAAVKEQNKDVQDITTEKKQGDEDHSMQVSIKSDSGKFLCAAKDGSMSVVEEDTIGTTFTMSVSTVKGEQVVSLFSAHGKFMSVAKNGKVSCTRDEEPEEVERFKMVNRGVLSSALAWTKDTVSRSVALESQHGQYITLLGNGKVIASVVLDYIFIAKVE